MFCGWDLGDCLFDGTIGDFAIVGSPYEETFCVVVEVGELLSRYNGIGGSIASFSEVFRGTDTVAFVNIGGIGVLFHRKLDRTTLHGGLMPWVIHRLFP